MKTVLITGASSGFGYVTTLLLARKGYTVYAGVRNLEKKESLELQEIAKKEHLSLNVIQLDVTKQSHIDDLKKIADSIDILINNAGIGFLGPTEEFTVEEVKDQFDINFFGVVRMIRAIVPSMRKKKRGMIINISSLNGLISFPLYGVYSSSKFALETYSESLRFELQPFNVKVALVEPGSFVTNFTKNKYFPQAQSDRNSPYISLTHHFFRIFKKFEDLKYNPLLYSFVSPDRIAERILAIIESSHPSLHNIVGIQAHSLVILNTILPRWIKNYLLRKAYRW